MSKLHEMLAEANVGKYAKAHHWTFPNIEYVLWAILIGLAIGRRQRRFRLLPMTTRHRRYQR